MAQTLGGVSRQVKNVVKPIFIEQLPNQRRVVGGPFDKTDSLRQVLPESSRQIIQSDDAMALLDQLARHMRAYKARGSRHERSRALFPVPGITRGSSASVARLRSAAADSWIFAVAATHVKLSAGEAP